MPQSFHLTIPCPSRARPPRGTRILPPPKHLLRYHDFGADAARGECLLVISVIIQNGMKQLGIAPRRWVERAERR